MRLMVLVLGTEVVFKLFCRSSNSRKFRLFVLQMTGETGRFRPFSSTVTTASFLSPARRTYSSVSSRSTAMKPCCQLMNRRSQGFVRCQAMTFAKLSTYFNSLQKLKNSLIPARSKKISPKCFPFSTQPKNCWLSIQKLKFMSGKCSSLWISRSCPCLSKQTMLTPLELWSKLARHLNSWVSVMWSIKKSNSKTGPCYLTSVWCRALLLPWYLLGAANTQSSQNFTGRCQQQIKSREWSASSSRRVVIPSKQDEEPIFASTSRWFTNS